MEKIINFEGINHNGWHPIYPTGRSSVPLVFYWLPATFKYSETNHLLARYTEYNVSGVRKNEQSRDQKSKLELGFKDCALRTRNRDLSNRGVAE